MTMVAYQAETVLEAARRRMGEVFDLFPARIVVSVSGGKDSTVLYHLALREAEARGRRFTCFFLDQEAEYQSTIDIIGEMMRHPLVDPLWVQVPLLMTNATSHRSPFLRAWWPGEDWIRPMDPLATGDIPGCPQRFYEFFPWLEKQSASPACFLVGIRSRESMNRFRAVTKSPTHGHTWMTKGATANATRAYPLFDWVDRDVWKYLAEESVPYNALYDRMYAKGVKPQKMRVSNLIHEQAFRCLADLQEFEPETYGRLLRRIDGVHAAALYAREAMVFDARDLPAAFATWRAYRDHLLDTTPAEQIDRYRSRFARQPADESTCRQQCKQVLTNDYEGSVPVRATKRDGLRALWWDRL